MNVCTCLSNCSNRWTTAAYLDGRDPCHDAWRIVAELMTRIVILKNANDIDPAKAGEQATESTQYYRPCFESSIWKVGWIGTGWQLLDDIFLIAVMP